MATEDKDDKDEKDTKDAAPAAEPVMDPEATSLGERAKPAEPEEPKAAAPVVAAPAEPVVAAPAAPVVAAPAAPVTTNEADAAKHADDDGPQFSEPDRINVGMILGITMAIVISTVVVVIGVREFFAQTIAGEVQKKVLEPEDPLKKELHVAEQAKLTKYQWVSQKDGVVRIPLARAKELVLADYGKLAVYDPNHVSAPPETPPPAPEGSVNPAASSSVAPSGSGGAAPMPSVAPPASAFGSAATSAAPSASVPAPKGSASAPRKH